jgi:hypothetical protein
LLIAQFRQLIGCRDPELRSSHALMDELHDEEFGTPSVVLYKAATSSSLHLCWDDVDKIRLTDTADRTWYTPDFKVLYPDGRQEFVEVKGGYIWEDGLLKFKIARSQFPEYAWSLWQRRKTQWVRLK